MAKNELLTVYRELLPALEKIYVIPDIRRTATRNSYLSLLYQSLDAAAPDISLHSFSFLSPAILLRRLLGEKAVLHHHWFQFHDLRSFLNAIWKIIVLAMFRLMGGKVVWTVHNRYPHHRQYRRGNRWLRYIWARLPQRIHVHCASAATEMTEILNLSPAKFFIHPHPDYPSSPLPKADARKQLAALFPQFNFSEKPLFLMFGYIADYKGIWEVVELVKSVSPQIQLLIAGPVKWGNENYWEKVSEAAAGNTDIFLAGDFIPENQMPVLMSAADYVLFNYRDILNSGGVVLAMNYRQQIIAPARGCLKELSDKNITLFQDEGELKQILEKWC